MSDVHWRIDISSAAQKALDRLAAEDNRRIVRYLEERVAVAPDPERLGKALEGRLKGLRRYRVGDYRIVVRVEKGRLVVVVVTIGHRREVYR